MKLTKIISLKIFINASYFLYRIDEVIYYYLLFYSINLYDQEYEIIILN